MSQNPWISNQPEQLPDFIIGGAMKSGTTTLHHLLGAHPDVFMAHNELGFFDMDSLQQHPDFHFFNKQKRKWYRPGMDLNPDKLWEWYHQQFNVTAQTGLIKGEDSTTYLASETAAMRIALQNKPIKLIFILRHPTKRSISNYLHLLKSGRAIYNLEDTINYQPDSILKRSHYKTQLEAYYRVIPRERIKVILFEDLIVNTGACLKDLCLFLNLDADKIPLSDLKVHANPTRLPKYLGLQLIRNRWLSGMRAYRYGGFLPIEGQFSATMPIHFRILNKLHKKMNPHSLQYRFEVQPATVELLDRYFQTELEGLDDLIEQPAMQLWFNKTP